MKKRSWVWFGDFSLSVAPGVKESWFGSGSLIYPEGGSMDIRYVITFVLSVNRNKTEELVERSLLLISVDSVYSPHQVDEEGALAQPSFLNWPKA